MAKIIFLHGLESRPGGLKVEYLRQHGHDILNPLLPKDSYEQSLEIAQGLVDLHRPDFIIGSSRGGALAMSLNSRGAKLILIAPAWKKYNKITGSIPKDTIVLHSPCDDVVPIEDSEILQKKSGIILVECGKCHRMRDEEALLRLGHALQDFGIAF
jgi:predicted esterase YcpF (UPF0227 family)